MDLPVDFEDGPQAVRARVRCDLYNVAFAEVRFGGEEALEMARYAIEKGQYPFRRRGVLEAPATIMRCIRSWSMYCTIEEVYKRPPAIEQRRH